MSKVRTPEPYLFDAFWQQWRKIARHTDGRGLARETFRKHVLNGVEPQDIIDGDNLISRLKPAFDGIADAIGVDDSKFKIEPPIRAEPVKHGAVKITLECV